jgi:predicted NUDIX family NTP pyrophosphohydrolase
LAKNTKGIIMPKISAGILMYRRQNGQLQVLLVHPGGPFWKNKDAGAWTIPKGEVADGEKPIETATREFEEETGSKPTGKLIELQSITQKGGKVVHAWAVEGDLDTSAVKSNTFKIEWPPKSGKVAEFPEIDRAEFFDVATAIVKINPAQASFIGELQALLKSAGG